MRLNYSKTLGLVAVMYFSGLYQAQQTPNDSVVNKTIEEVVVIGYGTQKKANVTGAISSVKAADIEKLPAGRVETVLQGRTSGVTVAVNAGQPGSAASVRVRGITTFGGSGVNNPLFIVDGIVMDYNSVGTINQNDIESMEVLKDAASSAIYGVSAAAGVVLITTKKGRKGSIQLAYNGYLGTSSVDRKLDLLNATEYATIINEKYAAVGQALPFADPASLGEGTNWQDHIFNTAARTSHEFSLSGGNDISTFYSSFGYQDLEGIVTSDISRYKRITTKLNSTHKFAKWLTVGQVFTYSNEKSVGLGNTNSEYGGPLSSALNLDPTTPVIETNPAFNSTGNYANEYIFRDPNGNPYGISNLVGQEMTNPLAYMQTRLGNYGWSDNFFGNAFAEISPLSGLTFKSVIGGKIAYYGDEGFTPKFFLSPTVNTIQNAIFRNSGRAFDWSFENYLTYKTSVQDHNFTFLLGTGYYKNAISSGSGVTYKNLPYNTYQQASFNFDIPAANRDSYAWGAGSGQYQNSSLFTRLIYDYKDKYLFTGIVRRDGSSKFGENHKYGTFPSVSLGWVASKEDFWAANDYVNTLKFRAGWGVNGNDKPLSPNQWRATMGGGRNYFIGGNLITGYSPNTLANPDLRWEETTQTNVGADLKVFNDFTLVIDWYNKVTNGILQTVRVPGYVGAEGDPWSNVADMRNTGFESELGYKKSIGELGINANVNFSYLQNEVTNIGELDAIEGTGFQSLNTITRSMVGHPYQSFYGFKTDGIFQNQSQIDAYKNSTGGLIQPAARPGDFKWVDINNDGEIDNNDRTFLGSPLPKYTFGGTLNLDYQNFDFMMFAQGAAGNKIFKGYRRLDILNANYTRDALGRWTGEGTSTDYPRLTNSDTNQNFSRLSDFYLEDGDYLRVKLVQFGYTLPKNIVSKIKANKVRFYISGENLVTFTHYTGFDPEVGGDISGIDRGFYPQAKSFLFGTNIQF